MKSFALLLVVAACGSKATPATTAPEPTASTALPDVPFDQLDHDQKTEFMKQKVMPAMQPIFVTHDAQEFAEFGCVTCHGTQAMDGHFDLPSDHLPRLNFKDMRLFKEADVKWMTTQVKPTMAKLLGRAEFDPTKPDPEAFGCQNCHIVE